MKVSDAMTAAPASPTRIPLAEKPRAQTGDRRRDRPSDSCRAIKVGG